MDRRDRRLQREAAGWAMPERLAEQRHPVGDLRAIPAGAVLLGEQQQPAIRRHPRRAAGVGQQEEREQPRHIRFVGQQRAHHPGQVERALDQVGPAEVGAVRGTVTGGEQQVQHGQHHLGARGEVLRGRDAIGDPRDRDLLLRPGDPRRHGRLETRNERATSRVDRPHSSRSVRATWDSGDSDGWQHVKISRSRSSGKSLPAWRSGSTSSATRSGSLRRSVCSRRTRSMARRRATVVSQDPGARARPWWARSTAPGRRHPAHIPRRDRCRASRAPSRRERIPTHDGARR